MTRPSVSHAAADIDAFVAAYRRLRPIDLSPLLSDHMPQYALHPDLAIESATRTYDSHGYHLQLISLPEHVGAHVDAPSHVPIDRDDRTIETFEPTTLWGRCITADVSAHEWAAGELLSLSAFRVAIGGSEILPGDIVLVHFGWERHLQPSGRGTTYWGANSPGFTEELCRYLQEAGVRAVGADTTTCDLAQVDGEVREAFGHMQYFLPNDILIIEGLANLSEVPPVSFFAAQPLRLARGSGSPLRPIALVAS